MPKRTPEDDEFIREFSRQLNSVYNNQGEQKVSDDVFARRIGVSRTGLQDYLNGDAMPSLRTVVLSFEQYKINVPYMGISLFPDSKRNKGIKRRIEQLTLPLAITAHHTQTVDMKLDPKGLNAFELRITIPRTG
jgi:hypothetical protein